GFRRRRGRTLAHRLGGNGGRSRPWRFLAVVPGALFRFCLLPRDAFRGELRFRSRGCGGCEASAPDGCAQLPAGGTEHSQSNQGDDRAPRQLEETLPPPDALDAPSCLGIRSIERESAPECRQRRAGALERQVLLTGLE